MIHIVHLQQVAEYHEKVTADHREVSVDFTLLVERDLQIAGLFKSCLDLTRLLLSRVQRLDQRLVL